MEPVIGIDVSKAKLDVMWLKSVEPLKMKSKVFRNDQGGHANLIAWLRTQVGEPLSRIRAVMEPTGVYHEALAEYLFAQGLLVNVINPLKAREFAKALGALHKTDKCDSAVLARYGAVLKPDAWQPLPPEIKQLLALQRRLNALDNDLRRERNRLEKTQCQSAPLIVLDSLHAMIAQLENEHARIEKEMDDHIDRHPGLKKDVELLQSIPGIGEVLSRVMVGVLRSRVFDRGGQCSAFVGVIPKLDQSGASRGRARLSKQGPAWVRAKLYMAAIVASQYNPQVKAHYERLLKRGKTKMQALGAAMRKLVHQCFGVLKHQTEYCAQLM
jgi:transposase